MARPKGQPKLGGRQKGTVNKSTGEIRDMIAGALSEVGGQKYFVTQAFENPVAFMGLIGKILPKEINAEVKGALTFVLSKEDVDI